MSRIAPSGERTNASLRDGLLVVAMDLLAAHGFAGLRMADVASRAGLSRQTVYNEFGNKAGLVRAVTAHRTAAYLTGVEQRLSGTDRPLDGVRDALEFMVEQASQDRLVASVVTGADAEGLLPFVTTRGLPVLLPAAGMVAEHLRRQWPDLPAERLRLVAETTVRLALSHLLMPSAPPEQAVEAVLAVARAILPEEG
ncbi:MAG: TetR family transcriptional regulator [Umezawaea sp.]